VNNQNFFYWLEEGGGLWLATRLALVLGLMALTIFYGLRRLEGPANEQVIERLVVARHVADGHGITTGVLHPQAVAVLEKRGHAWAPGEPLPELYDAPLYGWVTGKLIGLLPEAWTSAIWRDPVSRGGPTPRFGGDFAVFWLNWLGLVVLLGLTYTLAAALFGGRGGVLATIAMATAQGFWVRLLDLGGVVLPACLMVGIGLLIWQVERDRAAQEEDPELPPAQGKRFARIAAIGVLLGLIGLAEYAALWLIPGVLVWLALSGRGLNRILLPAVALLLAALVLAPWFGRNIGLTGHPLALAGQALSLKSGDPTAEPDTIRALLTDEAPEFSLFKVGRKGLEAIEANLGGGLWKEGGGVMIAFLVAGLLHRFRSPAVNRTRWALVGIAALVVVGAGFTGDRSEAVPVAAWVAPVWIILGVGFLGLLADAGGRSAWVRIAWVSAAVLLHALPMLRGLVTPSGNTFRFPPYLPHVAAVIREDVLRNSPGAGAMSDRPAGMAWYGAIQAWNQPVNYRDFFAINLRKQELGVLLLTPARLDQPFFAELLQTDPGGAIGLGGGQSGDWAQVYRGLAGRNIPGFFPLRQPLSLGSNIFVLVKPNLTSQSPRR